MGLNEKIDLLKEEIILETQKLIKIKSVQSEQKPGMPFGEEVNDALMYTLELGKKLGFKTKNVDGYMGYLEYGEGEEMVGVLGHLDIVPEGDGWDFDPYGGEIHEGKIFGRGAIDDKGPILACIYGLYALKEEGFNPNKRIRILLGTNEETGSQEVGYYLEKEEAPTLGFTPDGFFPIIFGEKGLTVFKLVKKFNLEENSLITYIKGGNRANMVPDYCEVGIKVETPETIMEKVASYAKANDMNLNCEINNELLILKSVGFSAHGSMPELGKNAIMQAVMCIDNLNICNGEVQETIRFLSENVGLETNGKSFGLYLKDDVSGELSFNLGTIDMNENSISVGMNLRYPVTCTFEQMMNPLEEKIKGMGFKVEEMDHQAPLYFPKDHQLIKILAKVYREQTGQEAELLAIGGGTYAKEMPNTVAFGPVFPGELDLCHQSNEYIEIEKLIEMTKIYANAIKELAQ